MNEHYRFTHIGNFKLKYVIHIIVSKVRMWLLPIWIFVKRTSGKQFAKTKIKAD